MQLKGTLARKTFKLTAVVSVILVLSAFFLAPILMSSQKSQQVFSLPKTAQNPAHTAGQTTYK